MQIEGFDEKVKLAEDHTYIREVVKNKGKFGILRSNKILCSERRFEKEGWVKTYLKYLLAELYLLIFGKIYSDIFKYNFDCYKD